jgi:hypothetical protein
MSVETEESTKRDKTARMRQECQPLCEQLITNSPQLDIYRPAKGERRDRRAEDGTIISKWTSGK